MDSLIFFLKAFLGIVLGLSILVVIHELGHFLPARWFGMRVEKFFLFFDWPRKMWSFTRGGTEYGIGWIPFGGYVKISGIIDESMDKDHVNTPPEPYEFRAKPVWQRMIVLAGGVTMNVILGCIIFIAMTYIYGEEHIPLDQLKHGIAVPEKSMAYDFGLRSGDKIVSLNEKPVKYLDEVATPAILLEDNACFQVERNGQMKNICVADTFLNHFATKKKRPSALFVPRSLSVLDSNVGKNKYELNNGTILQKGDHFLSVNEQPVIYFDQLSSNLANWKGKEINVKVLRNSDTLRFATRLDTSGKLGLAFKMDELPREKVKYSLLGSIVPGTMKAFGGLMSNLKGLGKVFEGKIDASKGVGGPVVIAKTYANTFDAAGIQGFWILTGMLSMWLAFINILPIPALDGGHLLLLAVEGIKGSPASPKLAIKVQYVGMVLLLSLMALIFLNDIFQAVVNP